MKKNVFKPRYKIAFLAKNKIWYYKDSRLRRFFNIRGKKLIRRGLFKLNDVEVNIPSIQVRSGDIVKPISFDKLHLKEGYTIPQWLQANVKEKYVKIDRLPSGDDVKEPVNAQLIVESYSR